jgi:hypothetical protein
MAAMGADIHRERAARAEQLADDARRRIPSAIASAERHERLVKAADTRNGELHVRAAALQRRAQMVFERAIALHEAHADYERRVAEATTSTPTSTRLRWKTIPVDPPGLLERYGKLARQEGLADQRDVIAEVREQAADQREGLADARDRAADDRDAVANARDDQLSARERDIPDVDFRHIAVYRRAHAARAEAASTREKVNGIRQAHDLRRTAAQADRDQAAIEREKASTQRSEAGQDE